MFSVIMENMVTVVLFCRLTSSGVFVVAIIVNRIRLDCSEKQQLVPWRILRTCWWKIRGWIPKGKEAVFPESPSGTRGVSYGELGGKGGIWSWESHSWNKKAKGYQPGVCSHHKHVCTEKHSNKSYKAKLLEIEPHKIIDWNISGK